MPAEAVIERQDGRLHLHLSPLGTEVTVESTTGEYVPIRQCVSDLPRSLIERIADLSIAWTCDALVRFQLSGSVAAIVRRQVSSYFGDCPRATRLLDFGCGHGASTIAIGLALPHVEVVGVELESSRLELARDIAEFREARNVSFLVSPQPDRLPDNLGQFDGVLLSAVYEHLLPNERRIMLPLLWEHLGPGGTLLINQTPYRWWPVEHHTTGLPLLNYAPDWLAYRLSRHSRTGREWNRKRDWPGLLRAGIRGGTEREILKILRTHAPGATIAQPINSSRAQYWLEGTSSRYRAAKNLIASLYGITDSLFGTLPGPHLDVAIRKPREN